MEDSGGDCWVDRTRHIALLRFRHLAAQWRSLNVWAHRHLARAELPLTQDKNFPRGARTVRTAMRRMMTRGERVDPHRVSVKPGCIMSA